MFKSSPVKAINVAHYAVPFSRDFAFARLQITLQRASFVFRLMAREPE